MGTIIYANTRAPTNHELNSRPHIVLTSDEDWDPHHIQFPVHGREEERQSIVNEISTSHFSTSNYTSDSWLQGTIYNPATLASRVVSSIQIHDSTLQPQDVPSAPNIPLSIKKIYRDSG